MSKCLPSFCLLSFTFQYWALKWFVCSTEEPVIIKAMFPIVFFSVLKVGFPLAFDELNGVVSHYPVRYKMFFYLRSIIRTSVRTPSNFMFLQLGISNRAQYSNSSHKNVKQGASRTSLLLIFIHQGVTVHLYVTVMH